MPENPDSRRARPDYRPRPIAQMPDLPAAAMPRRASPLFTLTLLSAVDGTLVMLGAAGRLSTLAGAVAVGLTVVAGAGSWIAARDLFGGRRLDGRDHALLAALGVCCLVATAASAWLGATLGQAVALHVLPKAAGVVLVLVGAEVAGLRLPRPAGAPLPVAVAAAAVVLEVAARWTY